MSSATDHRPPEQHAAPVGVPAADSVSESAAGPVGPAQVRRPTVPAWLRRGLGLTLIAACVPLAWLSLAEPEVLDKAVGNAKVAVHKHTDSPRATVGAAVAGLPGGRAVGEFIIPDSMVLAGGSGQAGQAGQYLPQVTLEGPGGERELDACTGGFTEMVEYRGTGGPALYSAHNTCEGDIILGWDIGQQFRVAGSETLYQVIEERRAMPYADTRVLAGMPGQLVLQTCFYGEEEMRFLAVSPVQGA